MAASGEELRAFSNRVDQLSRIIAARERRTILQNPVFDDPLRLERSGFSVWSQNDEDGYLQEIFGRLAIERPVFLEIGVQNGLENNTHFLLARGCMGCWIEASAAHFVQIRQLFGPFVESGQIRVLNATAEPDNINELLISLGIPTEIDLLSIDIDGHDYFVWGALTHTRPRVVVIEYNGKIPPPTAIVQPYRRGVHWDGTDGFGASLSALEKLGRKKGYCLVGSEIVGANAFFVREDLVADLFQRPFTAENHYHPCRYELTCAGAFRRGHPPAATKWVHID